VQWLLSWSTGCEEHECLESLRWQQTRLQTCNLAALVPGA